MKEFDPTIYYLGTLCKRGHNYSDDGRSLKYICNNSCVDCNNMTKEEKQKVDLETKIKFNETVKKLEKEFDPKVFRLGSLCINKHDFRNSGYSLRYMIRGGCVKCKLKDDKKYQETDKGKKATKKYHQSLKGKISSKKHYENNKEKILKNQRAYNKTEKGKENSRKNNKKYQKTEKGRENSKKHNRGESHKKATKKYRVKNQLAFNISSSIYHALKSKKNNRHWESIVNYTLQDLTQHLKNRLEDNMVNLSYGKGKGKLHIDHIIPVNWFGKFESYSDPKFQLCFSLENLQPLLHEKNSSKRNYRIETNNKISREELLDLLIKYFEVVEVNLYDNK